MALSQCSLTLNAMGCSVGSVESERPLVHGNSRMAPANGGTNTSVFQNLFGDAWHAMTVTTSTRQLESFSIQVR
eukprot:scaffold3436_cov156-Skeletonema_menzelii.AAC.6